MNNATVFNFEIFSSFIKKTFTVIVPGLTDRSWIRDKTSIPIHTFQRNLWESFIITFSANMESYTADPIKKQWKTKTADLLNSIGANKANNTVE